MARVSLVFLTFLLTCFPLDLAHDDGSGDPLRQYYDAKNEKLGKLAEVVKLRFAVYAAASACDYGGNLYSFKILLSKFNQNDQRILKNAADEGLDEGRKTVSGPKLRARCNAAIDTLRAADDELLTLAERVPRG